MTKKTTEGLRPMKQELVLAFRAASDGERDIFRRHVAMPQYVSIPELYYPIDSWSGELDLEHYEPLHALVPLAFIDLLELEAPPIAHRIFATASLGGAEIEMHSGRAAAVKDFASSAHTARISEEQSDQVYEYIYDLFRTAGRSELEGCSMFVSAYGGANTFGNFTKPLKTFQWRSISNLVEAVETAHRHCSQSPNIDETSLPSPKEVVMDAGVPGTTYEMHLYGSRLEDMMECLGHAERVRYNLQGILDVFEGWGLARSVGYLDYNMHDKADFPGIASHQLPTLPSLRQSLSKTSKVLTLWPSIVSVVEGYDDLYSGTLLKKYADRLQRRAKKAASK